jgi:hypothetical protein
VQPLPTGQRNISWHVLRRHEEVRAVEQALFHAEHCNSNHFLIKGERGIGKSSLFLLLDFLAKGEIPFNGEQRFNFIVVEAPVEAETEPEPEKNESWHPFGSLFR